jgi:2-polyprenyl-6-methoxyphenol hydroxylase-like FAD-dependent oxidoreductase
LMLACCIAQMDKRKWIELDIYEASAELAEIGAGVTFSSRIFEMLSKIGLEDDILKYCERENADSCSSPLVWCLRI